MKIANIIHESELVNHTKSDYINYINAATSYNDVDKSLPTLYVGWSFMKSCNPINQVVQNADILKKRIVTNELYWEFSFKENKASHIKGVDEFVALAPELHFKPKHIYTNLDPVFFQLRDVQDLMDVIPKKIDVTYHYKDEMFYILADNKIWGINLKMYDYFKFSLDEITSRIMQRTTESFYDSDGTVFQKYYKIFPNFELLKRYIVAILSK